MIVAASELHSFCDKGPTRNQAWKLSVSKSMSRQPIHYAIRLKEHIPVNWSAWFDGLSIVNLENDGSILSGPVADQPALHGLLAKVRDLNLTLISVIQIKSPQQRQDPVKLDDINEKVDKNDGNRNSI